MGVCFKYVVKIIKRRALFSVLTLRYMLSVQSSEIAFDKRHPHSSAWWRHVYTFLMISIVCFLRAAEVWVVNCVTHWRGHARWAVTVSVAVCFRKWLVRAPCQIRRRSPLWPLQYCTTDARLPTALFCHSRAIAVLIMLFLKRSLLCTQTTF